MERIEVEKLICKLKRIVQRFVNNQQYEMALKLVSLCANILYDTNIYYVDLDLELVLQKTAQALLLSETCERTKEVEDFDTVLFYDGFGLDNRGLAKIYLRAIGEKKKLCYVTYKNRCKEIPEILSIIHSFGGNVFYLEDGKKIDQIKQLDRILKESRAGHFFLYAYPNDVVATTLLYGYAGVLKRYQINLTDHAFWLGSGCMDVCIEFRDYGASISAEYRKIPKERITILPFYPDINRDQPFLGFPFPIRPENKVVFSGGSLYKTLGKGNKYYEVVEHLLSKHQQAVFWYAGSGDDTMMKKLMAKYPERLFLTSEREDLFQLLQNCYFYLSTYPVSGGLMFQYAACAGKVPLTLRSSDDDGGLLINQEQLGIEFDSIEELKHEIDHFMEDEEYALQKSARMKDSVISQKRFQEELSIILEHGFSNYPVTYKSVNVEAFLQVYLDRSTSERLYVLCAQKDLAMVMLRYFPEGFLLGAWSKMCKKIRKQ